MRRIPLVGGAVLLACIVAPAMVFAQSVVDPVDEALAELAASGVPTPPIALIAIRPCRLADTRSGGPFPPGPFGPPSLVAGQPRVFPIASTCGIPATAQVVSANITVANTSAPGFISLWPAGDPMPNPLVSSLNYFQADIKANAVIVPLGTSAGVTAFSVFVNGSDGALRAFTDLPSGVRPGGAHREDRSQLQPLPQVHARQRAAR